MPAVIFHKTPSQFIYESAKQETVFDSSTEPAHSPFRLHCSNQGPINI